MTEVVINDCFGGFSLSVLAQVELARRQGKKAFVYSRKQGNYNFDGPYYKTDENAPGYMPCVTSKDYGPILDNIDKAYEDETIVESRPDNRNDPDLVAVVKELGEKANGAHANLKIVSVPDDVAWHIEEYDGAEHVAENHRKWF